MQNAKQKSWHIEKALTITKEPLNKNQTIRAQYNFFLEINPIKFIHTTFKTENALNTLHRIGV